MVPSVRGLDRAMARPGAQAPASRVRPGLSARLGPLGADRPVGLPRVRRAAPALITELTISSRSAPFGLSAVPTGRRATSIEGAKVSPRIDGPLANRTPVDGVEWGETPARVIDRGAPTPLAAVPREH